jgi:hypothetical protein
MGTVSDEGALALLESPSLTGLTKLTLDCEGLSLSTAIRERLEARFGKQ